jgi:heme-degrading monooxygenase HmoA
VILEVAILNVKPGSAPAFEKAFDIARNIIASMPGFVSLELDHYYDPFPEVEHYQAVFSSGPV